MTKHALDVCLSPELIDLFDLEGQVAVVVDILRATSCITAGIGSGIDHIIPFSNLEACRQMREQGYLIAGERNGEKVEGFDIGNSPFSYIEAAQANKPVAVTTTNGTVAIERSLPSDEILIGSFLNISAVCNWLVRCGKPVTIVCAGWKGKVNLEDTLFAGALVHQLRDEFEPSCDAPLVAEGTFLNAGNNLIGALEGSSHVNRLKRLNIIEDIRYFLKTDEFDTVPIYKNGRIIAA